MAAQTSLSAMNEGGIKNLADILVTQGSLTEERAKQVKLAEIQSGKNQEEILKDQNLVSEEALVKAKAALYNIPYVDLSILPSSPEALSVLPQEVAEKFSVFPISIDAANHTLVLAMSDPLDLSAIEFIEQKTGYRIKPEAGIPSKIKEFVQNRYSTSLAEEVTEALKEVSDEGSKIRFETTRTGVIREERIAEIVSRILEFAIKSRSSDVHIEPQEKSTRVRYRVDGILVEKLTIPKNLHDALISRIKILSGLKIDEKRVPQDGRFNFKAEGEEVDLRISTLPTAWGEKVVMRLLKKSGGVPTLNELGLRGRALRNLEEAILRPHGIILICGPTGSGKTTTLYSSVSKISTPKVNIVTLLDTIE